MKRDEIKKKILKDNYVNFAYQRYLNFKETPMYDESYKFEILEELNAYFQNNTISETTVVEIAKKIQKSNPTAGSFVHWSNTANLVNYAEQRPTEVSKLWNHLYDETVSVEDRIADFRAKAQKFDSKIALGAPLFGYLLAAYDYTTYPLYKGDIYQEAKSTYEIEQKMGSVSDNYSVYFMICQVILEHLKKENPDLTMLDVQDFLYCSNRYNKVRVESAVDYLHDLATTFSQYKEDQTRMVQGIMALDQKFLQEMCEIYRDGEKVRKIRFMVIDKILEEGMMTITDLENMKSEVSAQYDTNILNSYNNFTILFHLLYYDKKDKVRLELGKIHQAIRQLDELKNFNFVEGKTLNGFNWNQSFGGSECWLAVYESRYKGHRDAPQFFMGITENGISYGLIHGDNHEDADIADVDEIEQSNQFTYEKMEEKMNEVATEINKIDTTTEKSVYVENEDVFDKEQWLNFLQDREIFREEDLTFMLKMYELGGEATGIELAAALNRQYTSFNAPVVALAKRIYNASELEPFMGEDEKASYWRVLFNGRQETGNRFKWIMKENLYEAISEYIQFKNEPGAIEDYTKDDFLKEVFIDEALYNTMSDLLNYKKNIILQGPPGVGKTFISKRLAYSLMGGKDNNRVEVVQFHQNYAYEDFIMGYRPIEGKGFGLEYGVFYDFCQKAMENPEQDYYFIIDEINRGNLSKIFGELFMLIEGDKRDEVVTMGYSKEDFTVSSNVYLIGTMNTADRSLAQLEVAMRRRFAFITLETQFNEKWQAHLKGQGVSDAMVERISLDIGRINEEIRNDYQLGKGYEIGHSFFTTVPEHLDENKWFRQVMTYEIKPLIEEYYFDRPEKVDMLLEGF